MPTVFFDHFGFECVTINPYMGQDSIIPFIENEQKGVFLLAKTSNDSSGYLQNINNTVFLFMKERVKMAKELNKNNNIGLVVGATVPEELRSIRELSPEMPFLNSWSRSSRW